MGSLVASATPCKHIPCLGLPSCFGTPHLADLRPVPSITTGHLAVESKGVGRGSPATVRSITRLGPCSRKPLSSAAPPGRHRGTSPGITCVSRTRPPSPSHRRIGEGRPIGFRPCWARHDSRRCSMHPARRGKSRLPAAWRETGPQPRITGLIRAIPSRRLRGAFRRVRARSCAWNRGTACSRGMASRPGALVRLRRLYAGRRTPLPRCPGSPRNAKPGRLWTRRVGCGCRSTPRASRRHRAAMAKARGASSRV